MHEWHIVFVAGGAIGFFPRLHDRPSEMTEDVLREIERAARVGCTVPWCGEYRDAPTRICATCGLRALAFVRLLRRLLDERKGTQ